MGCDRYILVDGSPVEEPDLLRWAAWLEDAGDARRLARDEVAIGVVVSTVFLGLDHAFSGGPPVLWETMVFRDDGGGCETRRYRSAADALAGHREVVYRLRGVCN